MRIKYWLNFGLCLVVSLCVAKTSLAQGIPLADPITVRELEKMSNDLNLTLEQSEAVISVYDRYLGDFTRVLENEVRDVIDEFAIAAESFGFMSFKVIEREIVDSIVRKALRALKAIEKTDAQFYDSISGMLSEKQRAILGRVALERKTTPYKLIVSEMYGGLNPGGRSHLRPLFNKFDIEPTVEMEELLDTYDQRYYKAMKQGVDVLVRTITTALDMIDELGLQGLDQQALMMRFMTDEAAIEDLKRRGDILLKPINEHAYEISQINWKTWNKLDSLLDEEIAWKLRKFYFQRSFRDVVRGEKKIEKLFGGALKLKELNEGQKVDLEDLESTFQSKWSKMTEDYADLIERSRQTQTVASLSREIGTEFDDRIASLENKRGEYVSKIESRIHGILGKELLAILQNDKKEGAPLWYGTTTNTDKSVATSTYEVQVIDGQEMEVATTSTSKSSDGIVTIEIDDNALKKNLYGGVTLPDSIPPSFPELASQVVGLDENGEMIIDSVYEEYRGKYDATFDQINLEAQTLIKEDMTAAAQKRKIRELTQKGAQKVAELDMLFFEDVVAVTGLDKEDANIKMLEHYRQRQRTGSPNDPFGWRGGEGDTIDLVGLYVMSKESEKLLGGLQEETIVAIRKSMQNYHESVKDQHQLYADAMGQLAHLEDAMYLMEGSDQNGAVAESIQRRWRETFTNVRDSKRALMLANQDAMAMLLESVPESDSWRVRMEFVKQAYPDVFDKSADATKFVTAALVIPSLESSQKSKLEDLASTYRFNYWDICEKMIENHQLTASAKRGTNLVNKEEIDRQLELESLRFKRKELSDRLQMRLRRILTEDQVKEVPGLRPTVGAPSTFGMK